MTDSVLEPWEACLFVRSTSTSKYDGLGCLLPDCPALVAAAPALIRSYRVLLAELDKLAKLNS